MRNLLIFVFVISSANTWAYTFKGITGPEHFAAGISADGTVVGGGLRFSGIFRWTQAGSFVTLPAPALAGGWGTEILVTGMSPDGRYLVGTQDGWYGAWSFVYDHVLGQSFQLPFINTSVGSQQSFPLTVANNGNIVGGVQASNDPAETGIADWIFQGGGSTTSAIHLDGVRFNPLSLSADGTWLAGTAKRPGSMSSKQSAFIWQRSNPKPKPLGHLSQTFRETYVSRISRNGSYVVGVSKIGPEVRDYLPYVWSQTKGMQGLPLPNGVYGSAAGISDNGNTIVGKSAYWNPNPGQDVPEPVFWRCEISPITQVPEYKYYPIYNTVPQNLSPGDLSAWLSWISIDSANDVSADGNTVLGSGIQPNSLGRDGSWLVTLPASNVPAGSCL